MSLDGRSEPVHPVGDPGSRWAPWLLAGLAAWAGASWLERLPAAFDEPLVLRWARACGEHPVRTHLALGLLLVAAGRLVGARRSALSGPGLDPRENL